ncbi:DUF5011 domain-containing protein [Mycoplasmatota bacterium]|nr:DUF5011 domain-containing protein [Mycoplasmatota bacterium]
MKKLLSFIALISMIVLNLNQLVHANQVNYLPGGKNYISTDNLEYLIVEHEESGSEIPAVRTIDKVMVKPDTNYVFSVDTRLNTQIVNVCITYYNELNEIVEEIIFTGYDYERAVFDGNSYHYQVFTTYEDVKFISLEMSGYDDSQTDASSIQIEEGIYPTAYEAHIPGTIIDTTSPYFQSQGTIISYVDRPISVEEIQSSLVAYDSIDGDVSDNISLVNDGYSDMSHTIGRYQLLFRVEDSSGNKSEVEISVEVVDVLDPVFSDVSQIEVLYPKVLSIEEILSKLSASDNYDGDISNSIIVESDDYSANKSIVGAYEMHFSVSDSSGNKTNHQLVMNVVDKEAPTISGESTIHVGYNEYYNEPTIISGLSVNDNYDDNIKLNVEENTYKDNYRQIGEYRVVFSATDSSGNKTEKNIDIHVVDGIGPMIYFDLAVIQVYSNQVMELPDFAQLLTKTSELKSGRDYSITVRYDSYTKHAKTPGTYHLKLVFEDEYGEIINKDLQVKVVDRGIDDIYFSPEDIELDFFQKNKKMMIYGGSGLLVIASFLGYFFVQRKQIL